MKKFNKGSNTLAVLLVLCIVGLIAIIATGGFKNIIPGNSLSAAAVSADLSSAEDFAVLAGAAISDAGGSSISGDVGLSPTGGTAITGLSCTQVSGSIYDTNAGYLGGFDLNLGCLITNAGLLTTAKSNVSLAYNDVEGQVLDTSVNASTTDSFAGTGYTLSPGVYNSGSSMGVPIALTLDGGGDPSAVFVFQAGSTLNTVAGSTITLTGSAQACNVFWQVGSSATLGTTSDFVGTIMAAVSITDTGGSTIDGRLLADADNTDADSTGAVTLNNTDVTVPTCVAPVAPQLIVNKVVINDNGQTKVISDFPLFIDGVAVTSGVVNTTTVGLHTISETSDANYTSTISGHCAINGTITLALNDLKTCTVTNDDIAASPSGGGGVSRVPPLIDVVKVPSPLALPNGPGPVTYTYTLRNIGIVSVTDITMVGDTCSPINLVSGDADNDAKLDVNEVWIFNCFTTLSKTHTNTVTATGWANGISAVDIASATVIVGVSIVPPLIHVTKIPNPLALLSGGGMVTYTNKVTNPGTVPLSNVRLADDKCVPVNYISGDTNSNSKLDISETWTYTCRTNLSKTTTNTITAKGDANGLTATDFAIATVVVPFIPGLPNTGFPPKDNNALVVFASISLVSVLFYLISRKKIA